MSPASGWCSRQIDNAHAMAETKTEFSGDDFDGNLAAGAIAASVAIAAAEA